MNNKTISLDSRLQAAYDYVSEGSIAADIGTDHGYLICKLALDNKINKGYATDINVSPLQSAISLINSLGLTKIINPMITDGLDNLPQNINEIIICGMGGDNIIEILNRHSWIKNGRTHLILQPMTRAEHVRKWLLTNGWYIDSETAVESNQHLYTVISSAYSGELSPYDDLYLYVGELPNNPSQFSYKYIKWQSDIQKDIANSLLNSNGNKNKAMSHYFLSDMLLDEADKMEGYFENG